MQKQIVPPSKNRAKNFTRYAKEAFENVAYEILAPKRKTLDILDPKDQWYGDTLNLLFGIEFNYRGMRSKLFSPTIRAIEKETSYWITEYDAAKGLVTFTKNLQRMPGRVTYWLRPEGDRWYKSGITEFPSEPANTYFSFDKRPDPNKFDRLRAAVAKHDPRFRRIEGFDPA